MKMELQFPILNLQQICLKKKRKNKEITLTFDVRNIETSKQIKCLRFIFQENELFNAHIKSVQVKCLKRLNVLRYLKSLKCGMSKDSLLSLYRTLVRPVIEYGKKVYFNSVDSLLKLEEKIQNDSLRLCSGALQSTSINCSQHHCNEMPLKIKFEQLYLYNRAHLYTLVSDLNHPASAVIKDNWQERFPSNPNFILSVSQKIIFLNLLRII